MALSADDVDLADWEVHRAALGVRDTGDFIGVRPWKRPQRYVHQEPSSMAQYADERAAHNVRDAPQASAGDPRENAAAAREALFETGGHPRRHNIREN